MKSLSRDARLVIGVIVLLVAITTFTIMQRRTQEQYPKLSTLSSAPDGALALKLWVRELQYNVDEQVLGSFAPPKDASIVFMLESISPTEER